MTHAEQHTAIMVTTTATTTTTHRHVHMAVVIHTNDDNDTSNEHKHTPVMVMTAMVTIAHRGGGYQGLFQPSPTGAVVCGDGRSTIVNEPAAVEHRWRV